MHNIQAGRNPKCEIKLNHMKSLTSNFEGDSFCLSKLTTFPPRSMYLSLCHESTDEPNKVLKSKMVRHVCPKFSMCEKDLRQFPVRQSVGSIFTNSGLWTAVHLRKNGEQIQRFIQDVEVDTSQTVSETVQTRNHRLQDGELDGLSAHLDWAESRWRHCSLLDEQIPEQSQSKVYVFSDYVLCLGGKCHTHPQAADMWANQRFCSFVSTSGIPPAPRHHRRTWWNSNGGCTRHQRTATK